jgi:oligogalacturonide lyase
MNVGDTYTNEGFEFTDSVSGRRIRRLTDYKGHSNTQYFTNDFWPTPHSFIFTSDRENRSNLFLCDLDDHRITQLTAFDGPHRPYGTFSKARDAFYFVYGNDFYELNLSHAKPRRVFSVPDGHSHTGMNAVTADGRYLCTAFRKARSNGGRAVYNKSPDYLDRYRDKPESSIVRVDIDSGSLETVHREHYFVEHVNASPADPGVLTFCHEGPWARIDQRIWGLDIESGRTWKIRPQDARDAAIGHEYFFPDGEWIGYHGRRRPEETLHFFGATRLDNSERYEHDFPYHCTHFISYGHDLFVGDGTPANVQPWFPSNQKPYLMIFRRTSAGFDGPRILAYHRATFNEQNQHPHAGFTPDGSKVIYTSDMGGYSNIHLVEVADFDDLPRVEDIDVEWGPPPA